MILHIFHCSRCDVDFTAMTEYNAELQTVNDQPCPQCAALAPRVFRPRGYQHGSIAPSERTVYDYNPATGEIKIPGRADVPLHPKRRAMGFVRRECTSIADLVKLERMTNRISERLHYDRGSSTRRPDGVDVD